VPTFVEGHVISPVDSDILVQDSIKLIEYSYKKCASFLSKAYLERTPGLNMLGLEKS
jgi:hypothetical protein